LVTIDPRASNNADCEPLHSPSMGLMLSSQLLS
jgi:hypothetical protein